MNIDIKLEQINQTQRIGSLKKDGGDKISRHIIVKCVCYADRCIILSNKKRLKVKKYQLLKA